MEPFSQEFLIDRLYIELNNCSNPNKKVSLERPEVCIANKKTFFSNFSEICQKLNRKDTDVKKYFEDELKTEVNILQDGGLNIVGIFRQPGIQKILGNYIKDFVACKECNSCDTELIKSNRITFISCNKCKSKKALK